MAVPTSATHSFSLSPRFLNDGTSSSAARAEPASSRASAALSIAPRVRIALIGLLLVETVGGEAARRLARLPSIVLGRRRGRRGKPAPPTSRPGPRCRSAVELLDQLLDLGGVR